MLQVVGYMYEVFKSLFSMFESSDHSCLRKYTERVIQYLKIITMIQRFHQDSKDQPAIQTDDFYESAHHFSDLYSGNWCCVPRLIKETLTHMWTNFERPVNLNAGYSCHILFYIFCICI